MLVYISTYRTHARAYTYSEFQIIINKRKKNPRKKFLSYLPVNLHFSALLYFYIYIIYLVIKKKINSLNFTSNFTSVKFLKF